MNWSLLINKLLASGFKEVPGASHYEYLYAKGDLQVRIRTYINHAVVLYPQLGDLDRLLKIPGQWLIARDGIITSSYYIFEKAVEDFMALVETFPTSWTVFLRRTIEKAFASKE